VVSKEKRELIRKARAEGMKMAEMARVYRVAESTLYNLFRLERETGSMEPRPYTRGRKPSLDKSGMTRLKALIEAHRDITLQEIKEEMELSISLSALSRIIRNKLGFTYKKRQYTRANEIGRT
jgi:transposase